MAHRAGSFEVRVFREELRFSSAHFICHAAGAGAAGAAAAVASGACCRERLHGHNYQLGVALTGEGRDLHLRDGYLLDFGDIKRAARDLCKALHERLLVPELSAVVEVAILPRANEKHSVRLITPDGDEFIVPLADCVLLPLHHSSVEELSRFCLFRILAVLDLAAIRARGVLAMEVTVSEAPGQEASFTLPLPESKEQLEALVAATATGAFGEQPPRRYHTDEHASVAFSSLHHRAS